MAGLDREALEIVEACLDAGPAERDRLIRERCAGSAELRDRVERMLAMDATRFRILPTEAPGNGFPQPEQVPDRIGPFRITGVVGAGGMGTVLQAERDDGLYRQTVAIKLIRGDVSHSRAQERFALERQILARLDHPSITRILDGGAIDGRPYLIMEYVEGRPVTVDLEARGAGLGERLDRFQAVCAAVSHAHRKLVVHADIKPSNVLACADGSVKLVDFGVSRLTAEFEEDHAAGPYPLTRGYAAPERLAGEPPTVAGDVYSLGALLHEMLTGSLPDSGRPMSLVAARGGSHVDPRSLKGDLDAIVARALAADPAQRYADVGELTAELARYRSGYPVRARPQTFGYRTGRFVWRHRLGLSLGTVVFLVLAAATALSLSLYFDARRQRAEAEARFEEVRSLAKYQLFTLYGQLATVPGTIAARARLSEEAQHYLDRLSSLPNAGDAVKLETAAGYNRLAEIQGVPSLPNLGRTEAARRNLSRAAALLAPLVAADRENAGAARELARTRLLAADMAIWQDNEAERGARLLAAAEPLVGRTRDSSAAWRDLDRFRRKVRLDMLGWSGRYKEEAAFATDTIAWIEGLPAAISGRPEYAIARSGAYGARAEGEWYEGDKKGSLADAGTADEMMRAEAARHPEQPAVLAARVVTGYNLITTLEPMHGSKGLLEMTQEVAAVARRVHAMEPEDERIAWHLRNVEGLLAQFLMAAGRHREAIAIEGGIVAADERRWRARPGDTRALRDLSFSRKVLGSLHWDSRARAEGCALWRQADAGFTRLAREGHLNEWDRDNVVQGLRADLKKCAGLKSSAARSLPATGAQPQAIAGPSAIAV